MRSSGERSTPRVTVITATYNWATVLPYSIGSVLDQTFTDFEFLVVGDACSDESAAVVTSIEDPRVRWINLPSNAGHQAGPNNEGQRQARGEIVAYLGHDDLWLPQHLELLVEAIDGAAASAHSSVLQVHPHNAPAVTPPDGWTYSRGNWLAPTSIAILWTVLEEVGGWRMPHETGHLDPDADLLARVYDLAGPPVWVRRLTCLKLAAAPRRDVYRTRPHHEQEHWLRTIRESADPEAAMLATVGAPYVLATDRPHVPVHTRAWRSMRYRLRTRLGIRLRATTRIRRNRRFKGL